MIPVANGAILMVWLDYLNSILMRYNKKNGIAIIKYDNLPPTKVWSSSIVIGHVINEMSIKFTKSFRDVPDDLP